MSLNKDIPSGKLLKYALKAIRDHPQVFEALEEYDKTRKLPKTVYRERINLTIDANILRTFKRYAGEKNLNMSRLVEKYMKKELGLK
ncbi:MAG: hypothetical protein QT02_C0009G0021 [archaeon GW2011_AR9]|nr:MAG: hypothetical protein QT02_C0009G0021 [archaeon GW2011_AR9]